VSPLTGYLALGLNRHLPDLGVLDAYPALALRVSGAVAVATSQVQRARALVLAVVIRRLSRLIP
jgi:hypothetical protein